MGKSLNTATFSSITKEQINEHKGICTSLVCLNTLKELEKTFLTQENIWKWERQLSQCNRCYLKNLNHSYLNTTTRWTVSTEVHFYKSKRTH